MRTILEDALLTLDPSALEQIAKHCNFSVDLALEHAPTTADKMALVKTDEWDTLRMLSAYCGRAIELRTKAERK